MENVTLFENLTHIVRLARTGDYGGASSAINPTLERIQKELVRAKPAERELAALMYSLETMLMMQKQGDWVALADVIEYEFIALLKKTIPS